MNSWRIIFRPAIRILNRFGYTQKFSLVWFASFIALAVLLASLYISLNQVIQPAQRQIDGLRLLQPMGRTLQLLQQHRGYDLVFASREHAVAASHFQVTDAALKQSFEILKRRLPAELLLGKDFILLQARWQRLFDETAKLEPTERFHQQTELVLALHQYIRVVADHYGLLQNTDPGTDYLLAILVDEYPLTLEYLGRLRALGVGELDGSVSGHMERLDVLVAQTEESLGMLRGHLAQVARFHPRQAKEIQALDATLNNSISQVLFSANKVAAKQSLSDSIEYFDSFSRVIDSGYQQMWSSYLPMAKQIVSQRLDHAWKMLYWSAGIAVVLFLFLVYFSVSMYYAIMNSVRSVAQSAKRFSSGDVAIRIHLEAADEMAQIGQSFNEMADAFCSMLEARREDDARVHAAIEQAMDAVVQMNATGQVTAWNVQAQRIFGWTKEEAIGCLVHELIIPPQFRHQHLAGMTRYMREETANIAFSRVEMIGLHRNGHEFPIELTITPIKIRDHFEFTAFIRDITEKKQSDEIIWRQANLDMLTGLPNRHMFYDRLQQDIKQVNRSGHTIALFFIDLDKFKDVNDGLGHAMGDLLLIEAAARISACVRETDTVARLGGDEFVVILRDLGELTTIDRIADSVLNKLSSAFYLQDKVVNVSASIGVTLYPDDATDAEQLLKNADQAMYAAKERGRNCFSYFTASMQHAMMLRQRLIADLRHALPHGEFRLYFQPIVDVITGRIIKAEALIRWIHPEFGLINPDRFIPLTEETGMVIEIGDWVFKQAVRQLKIWQQVLPSFQMSINISPLQFQRAGDTCEKWLAFLENMEVSPRSMLFEITEGMLLESEQNVRKRLSTFRNAGVQVAIDDFGTGYSSLSYLKKFDIDVLKIDKSFAQNLATDNDSMVLSEAIIVLAHKLGLKVVAEGIETEAQKHLLDLVGCDFLQGYLYSPPVPAEKFELLLRENLAERNESC